MPALMIGLIVGWQSRVNYNQSLMASGGQKSPTTNPLFCLNAQSGIGFRAPGQGGCNTLYLSLLINGVLVFVSGEVSIREW